MYTFNYLFNYSNAFFLLVYIYFASFVSLRSKHCLTSLPRSWQIHDPSLMRSHIIISVLFSILKLAYVYVRFSMSGFLICLYGWHSSRNVFHFHDHTLHIIEIFFHVLLVRHIDPFQYLVYGRLFVTSNKGTYSYWYI